MAPKSVSTDENIAYTGWELPPHVDAIPNEAGYQGLLVEATLPNQGASRESCRVARH